MKFIKKFCLTFLVFFCISSSLAWLDPPSQDEKEYFRENLWNMSQKEFSSFGIVLTEDFELKASTYIYTRKTLPENEWSPVFQSAFEEDPEDWTQVYDFVLNEIDQRNYYETFGYFNLGNETYWVKNINITESCLNGTLISPEGDSAGNIYLKNSFWHYWSGETEINQETYSIVLLNFED